MIWTAVAAAESPDFAMICPAKPEFARNRIRVVCAIVAVVSICVPGSSLAAPARQSPAAPTQDGNNIWKQSLLDWRTQRAREISAPDGWLTLIGLEWLKPGVNKIGTAADCTVKLPTHAPPYLGLLTVSGKIVQLLSPAGGFPEGTTVDGAPAREGPITVSDTKPSIIAWHGISMAVLDRGGRYALRIKDSDSPARAAHQPLHWYDPDPRYRIAARWVPFDQPMIEKIPTVIGANLDMPSPGYVTFTLDGKPYRLQPVLEAGERDKLFFILRDSTSETTTYGGGRFLHTGLPDHGLDRPGQLVLDFNQLYNPPCAYTSYATCPLPPEHNRLPIPLPAGEQRYLPQPAFPRFMTPAQGSSQPIRIRPGSISRALSWTKAKSAPHKRSGCPPASSSRQAKPAASTTARCSSPN